MMVIIMDGREVMKLHFRRSAGDNGGGCMVVEARDSLRIDSVGKSVDLYQPKTLGWRWWS